jgi:hypothetical protein
MHARPNHDDLVAMMIAQESDAAPSEPCGFVQRGEPLQFDLWQDGDVMGSFARHVPSIGMVMVGSERTLPAPSQVLFWEGR